MNCPYRNLLAQLQNAVVIRSLDRNHRRLALMEQGRLGLAIPTLYQYKPFTHFGCIRPQILEVIAAGDLLDLLRDFRPVYFHPQFMDLCFQETFALADLNRVVDGDRCLGANLLSWRLSSSVKYPA